MASAGFHPIKLDGSAFAGDEVGGEVDATGSDDYMLCVTRYPGHIAWADSFD
jgi:hypothetical protein